MIAPPSGGRVTITLSICLPCNAVCSAFASASLPNVLMRNENASGGVALAEAVFAGGAAASVLVVRDADEFVETGANAVEDVAIVVTEAFDGFDATATPAIYPAA